MTASRVMVRSKIRVANYSCLSHDIALSLFVKTLMSVGLEFPNASKCVTIPMDPICVAVGLDIDSRVLDCNVKV